MEFSGAGGWAVLAGVFVLLAVVMQGAFEGLILGTGFLVLHALALGRLKLGRRRTGAGARAAAGRSFFFYVEDGVWHVYRETAVIVGLAAWLVALISLKALAWG